MQVQDPDVVERCQIRRRGLAQSSTQYGLTIAEVEDQRLNQQRRIQTRDIPPSRIQQQLKRKWIAILDSDFIQTPIIDIEPYTTSWLFDEQNWSSRRRSAGTNPTLR